MRLIYPLLFLLFLYNACSREKEIIAVAYRPVAEGRCNADTTNAYHYLLPGHQAGNLPLLIILDSGGDGLLAVHKVATAVSRIPCVVIGSDLVRNNFPGYVLAIDMLIEDACQKFPVTKEQVYIAGFSGGARMAFEYARYHPVKGVLMCGAGPTVKSFRELPCPVYMIAGTTDFNFAEMYYNPWKTSGQHNFLADYFKGSHEWPPADKLMEGLLFLIGRSVQGGESLLKLESDELTEDADSLIAMDETLLAVKAAEKAHIFNPNNKAARKLFEKIRTNRKYVRNMLAIESDLALENKINQAYSQASVEQDSIWWTREIRQLSIEITNNSGDRKDHFLRIKGFLGILFYSQLNTLIRSQSDSPQIVQLLAAYRMAEPENPDVYYAYAMYAWKQGDEQLSRKYLKMSLALGFRDTVKLESDFPAAVLHEIVSQEFAKAIH